MNRHKFLQRIIAANLEGSATAELAAEALIRAIAVRVMRRCHAGRQPTTENQPTRGTRS